MIKVNKDRGKYNNAHTGRYKVKNTQKYIGQQSPIYKSKLELLFMRYLDNSKQIKWWIYEPQFIYYMDKSTNPPVKRKYYIDFKFEDVTGKIHWVEVKSSKECHKPENDNPRDMLTWIKNSSKWNAARVLAESRGYKFSIITEKELK